MITTPNDFLKSLSEISQQIRKVPRARIDQSKLFEILNGLFLDSNIEILNSWDDIAMNQKIVLESLRLCDNISENDFKTIREKLLKIHLDDETRKRIVEYGEKRSIKRFILRLSLLFVVIILLINFFNKEAPNDQDSFTSPQSLGSTDGEIKHQNGDLNSEFSSSDDVGEFNNSNNSNDGEEKSQDELIKEKEIEWKKSGWEEKEISNGVLPDCYNVSPRYSKINNYLDINVGGGTDVVIKLIERKSDRCVRYVFINRNSNYVMRNIPEGEYYLKIAYGKNWYSKIENHLCKGKFLLNAFYEVGNDNLDFTLKYYEDGSGYDIPSYRLSLDVQNSDVLNSFSSERISESDFNE